MNRPQLNQLMDQASEILRGQGLECIEIDWDSQEQILRVFIDRIRAPIPEGDSRDLGVTLDQCVVATHAFNGNQLIDNAWSGPFHLEVSSPGVERPLRRIQDFERFLGKMIEVKLTEPSQGRKHGKGRLASVEPEHDDGPRITLETTRGPWQFSLKSLLKANVVFEWGQGPN